MSGVVLACVAHADDEVLGCGASLALHAAHGDKVHIAIMADGVTSRETASASQRKERHEAANRAAEALGAQPPILFGFEDQRLDQTALLDLTRSIEGLARQLRPTIVYTHHADDLNADHRAVCQATLTAFRPVPGQTVRAIYAFETLSSTEWAFSTPAFRPNRFVDVSSVMPQKRDALRCYEMEMRPFPHSRSFQAMEALATLRGASVGVPAAEAFEVLLSIGL